jgi:hypothetical protein
MANTNRELMNTDNSNRTLAWMIENAGLYTDDSMNVNVNALAHAAARTMGYSDVRDSGEFYQMARTIDQMWDGVRF